MQHKQLIYQKIVGSLKRFHEDRNAKGMAPELVGLFIFGLIIAAVWYYVVPSWNNFIVPYLGFAGSYATLIGAAFLFMVVGYGLIRYGKGHKGIPS